MTSRRRTGELIAAAGVALLATSATAPPMGVAGHPAVTGAEPAAIAQRPPRERAAEIDPQRVPRPAMVGSTADIDVAGSTIPATFTGDIPATVIDAYRRARDAINRAQPGCHLPLELLAAIGKVETGHALRGWVDSRGTAVRPILGPVLDGNGFAAIPDTDHGVLDGDITWDRAVGLMQFLPATWQRWRADGNGDHRADPQNVYDASLGAAGYLCAGNRDLVTPQGLDQAIGSYNHSASYRDLVLRWMATYANGTTVVPDAAGRPVRAVMVPPTRSIPPAPGTPARPPSSATPAPPIPTAPPAGVTPPPVSPPVPPPADPIVPPPAPEPAGPARGALCDVGGIVDSILGPIIGTPVLPLCPAPGSATHGQGG